MTRLRTARTSLLCVSAAVLLGTGCSAVENIASLPQRPAVIARDTAAPVALAVVPAATVELGDTLRVIVTDDHALARAALLLLDSSGVVVWRSPITTYDPRRLPRTDTVRVVLAGVSDAFPFGHALNAVGWVQDSVGTRRYSGPAGDSTLTDSTKAARVPVTVADGRTFRPAPGGLIGGLAYDAGTHRLYFTDTPHNAVRSASLDAGALDPWTIYVGSAPQLLAFHPFAWGAGTPALVVFNGGGTDFSVVDLTTAGGGQQRGRPVPLPLLKVQVDSTTLTMDYTASSVVLSCPTVQCDAPTLFFGNPSLSGVTGVAASGVTRSLAVTSPNPEARLAILAPRYSTALAGDAAVTIRATTTDRTTGTETLVYTRTGASRCGTLAFGGTAVATASDPMGPILVGETAVAAAACGSAARVLRYERQGADYVVSASALLSVTYDPAVHGTKDVALNADGSLALLVAPDKVFLADAQLRRLATWTGSGITGAVFLEGQRGGVGSAETGGLVAVAAASGVTIYELDHYRAIAHLTPAQPIEGRPVFVRIDGGGGVAIAGVSDGRKSLTVIRTTIPSLLQRQAP